MSYKILKVVNKYTPSKGLGKSMNIMRPNKWGNQFPVGSFGRLRAISKHRYELLQGNDSRLFDLHELVGHELCCCCAPSPCHGDTYIELWDLVCVGKLHEQVSPKIRDRMLEYERSCKTVILGLLNKYGRKDVTKFEVCNKLISRGVGSSGKYANEGVPTLDLEINAKEYVSTDIVGVSVNGHRRDRVSFDVSLLDKVILAGATVVKDNEYHTQRSFNAGERELEVYLKAHGYVRKINVEEGSSWVRQ